MEKIDLEFLHNAPVILKLKAGASAEGILFKPMDDFFESKEDRTSFNNEAFIFLTNEGLRAFREAATQEPQRSHFWDYANVIPKDKIEYIDIGPLISLFAQRRAANPKSKRRRPN
jgi:hypothetical protein